MTGDAPWRPGSQAERTSMAWMRTLLATLLGTAAVTRLALLDGHEWGAALAATGGVWCLASMTLWWGRARRTQATPDVPAALETAAPGAVLAAVLAVCCLGVVAFGLGVAALHG